MMVFEEVSTALRTNFVNSIAANTASTVIPNVMALDVVYQLQNPYSLKETTGLVLGLYLLSPVLLNSISTCNGMECPVPSVLVHRQWQFLSVSSFLRSRFLVDVIARNPTPNDRLRSQWPGNSLLDIDCLEDPWTRLRFKSRRSVCRYFSGGVGFEKPRVSVPEISLSFGSRFVSVTVAVGGCGAGRSPAGHIHPDEFGETWH